MDLGNIRFGSARSCMISMLMSLKKTNQWSCEALQPLAPPCFWLRGMVPYTWTIGKASLAQDQPMSAKVWGALMAAEKIFLPAGTIAGTDGSGGAFSRDPRLSRAGWGLMLVNAGMKPFGVACGGLRGKKQTVPRAELMALVQLAERTHGHVQVVLDCTYVHNGFMTGMLRIQCRPLDSLAGSYGYAPA